MKPVKPASSAYLDRRRQEVEHFLAHEALGTRSEYRLDEAMRYSLLNGGKRLRPLLTLAACDAVGGLREHALPFAAAVEMIHTYSLIHDDLPAMDDDMLRRGKPTNHVVYGEALAILAGDALLTEAFHVIARCSRANGLSGQRAMRALGEIAAAAGARGMVAGQAADMEAEHHEVDLPTVEFIHIRKTGELIRAAVRSGAIVGGASDPQLRALTRYADCLGLGFQVADDVLDVAASSKVTGKTRGRDQQRHKATYPAILGAGAARARALELISEAVAALKPLGSKAGPLRTIATGVSTRL